MRGDSPAKRRRRDYVIDHIETVPMTAEQYDEAVNAWARLIVAWAAGRFEPDSGKFGHPEGD
jgi:hypothetical protein